MSNKYKGDERREIVYVSDKSVDRGIKVEAILLAMMIGIGGLSLWFIKDMAVNIRKLTERSIVTSVTLNNHIANKGAHR